MDPRNNNANPAEIVEESSATPMVAPDGTVFFGAFGNPYNGSRGFMLHFSADLQTEYTAGAFGWDDTASIVPASMVPSYTGTSSYLIFVKYNNYVTAEAGPTGGDGVNEIALLDPYASQADTRNDGDPNLRVMKEVLTIPGPTPDTQFTGTLPNAVREWCINTAAVDPFTKSVIANSEDGVLYRWDLTTDTLAQAIRLTGGIGEAYTPTAIGPDGTVYAINDHVLFAVGGLSGGLSVSESSSATPSSTYGQSVTFTAAVTSTGTAPTGSVTFSDGSTVLGTVPLDASGHAAFTTLALSAGRHMIQAAYSGDGNYAPGGISLIQAVLQTTAPSVASSAAPSLYGQAVTFTATVSPGGPTANVPEGTVTFLDGATVLGTATLNAGAQATFTTSALSVGFHSITVQYGGDTNFTPGTSAAFNQAVQSATATAVSSSANPSVFGQSVTFSAAVTATSPGAGTPTGTVTFFDGSTALGTGTLDGTGHATFTTGALAVAGHTITASYGGDALDAVSTSAALTQTVNKDATAAAVSSSANPSVSGQSVTFTATVTANSPGAGTPAGTVTFLDGATTLGTATLGGGSATFSTSALSVAGHSITVSYGGDGNFTGSTSAALTQTVNKDGTAAAVSSSVNPSVFGQSVTFTAAVSASAPGAGTPTGTVTFLDGATTLGTATLSGGSATFSTSALAVAGHSITVSYGGDGNFTGSASGALTQTVNQDGATTAVSSSANPSVSGQSVTFTATVSANSPGAGTPTGTVTFLDGATTLGTATLSGGSATYSTSALSVAGHPITVSYGGDGNFTGSTSGALTQTVNKDVSADAVSSSTNPSVFGQSVTFTATVSASAPGAGTPTGTVTFLDGVTTLGTATLSGGSATFSTSALAVAGHSITVSYGGDANFAGSTSPALTQTVNKDATSAAVSSATNPSVYGQSVTFTATVSASAPGAGTPTGTVTFMDGAATLGTATLSGGSATFSTSALSAAGHSITVSYGGDGNFTASTSATLTQTVNQAATTASVASSANPSVFGQSVTFTATVNASAPGAGTPTGTVTFMDGSTTLGTANLSGGSAAFSTSALAVAGHSITASYGGDANFTGNTSGALTQTVNQDATTTAVASSANPSVSGQSVTFTATVTAGAPGSGTPTGTVTFFDGSTALGTGTLSGGSATYSTSALALGGHGITATYNADADFTGSTSAALTQTVNANVTGTTTALASSANPSVFGQSVTFTATVQPTSGSGTPTGTVTFFDGSNTLGSATLSGGRATYSTAALSVGSHSITARYGGDPNYLASTSGVLTQTVNKAATGVIVTSSDNPATKGSPVTYSATVTAQAPGAGIPTGTVTFYDSSKLLGTAALNSQGIASAVFSLNGLGGHPITAVYAGDVNFTGSTSPVYTETITKFSVGGSPATLGGRSAAAGLQPAGTTDLALALFGPAPSPVGMWGGVATSAGAASPTPGGVAQAQTVVLAPATTLAQPAELNLGGTGAREPAVAELDRLFAAFGKDESAGGDA
jgi:hypothetical protein